MAQDEVVRSLLVPVQGRNLLLPSTVVAEVVSYAEPEPAGNDEQWFLGMVRWRDQKVPAVSFEAADGGTAATPGARARFAVLKALNNRPGMPYFAVMTQQIPRLLSVYRDTIEVLEGEGAHGKAVRESVLVNGEPAVIPDLDYLEGLLHQHFS